MYVEVFYVWEEVIEQYVCLCMLVCVGVCVCVCVHVEVCEVV